MHRKTGERRREPRWIKRLTHFLICKNLHLLKFLTTKPDVSTKAFCSIIPNEIDEDGWQIGEKKLCLCIHAHVSRQEGTLKSVYVWLQIKPLNVCFSKLTNLWANIKSFRYLFSSILRQSENVTPATSLPHWTTERAQHRSHQICINLSVNLFFF